MPYKTCEYGVRTGFALLRRVRTGGAKQAPRVYLVR